MTAALTVQHDVALQSRNCFRVPACADAFAEVDDPAALAGLRRQFPQGPTLVLGEGSNLLLTGDVPGLTLAPRFLGRALQPEGDATRVRLMAGERWHEAVMWTLDQGLGGLENLALIWGHCGAAPIQNIGAYGVELERFIDRVEVYDWMSGERQLWSRSDCRFGYRDSVFKHWSGAFVVIAIELLLPKRWTPMIGYAGIEVMLERLHPGLPATPARVADAVIALRRQKLPDPSLLPNAGSFFHNPLVDAAAAARLHALYPDLPAWPQPDGRVKLSAGWLIERAGCKGLRIGDAGVSALHALVLVNHGTACGAELLAVMAVVQSRVAERFGVSLMPEPRLVPTPVTATTLAG